MNWIGENLGKAITEFFVDMISDILERAFKLIAEVLFNPEELTGFFSELYGIFVAVGAMLIVCIALFRVLTGLFEAHKGDSWESNLVEITLDTFKASAMVPILPFILWLVLGKIVYPLGEYMFGKIGTFSANEVSDLIQSGNVGAVIGNSFMFILVFGFICIAVFAFFIKMCIYHADILLLQLLSPLAAISIMANDNNYAGIWWREFLSQIVTIVVQVACMVGVVEILTGSNGGMSWYKFMLLVGLCVLLIRGPSVTRNMWYATGSGKTMMHQGGKLAARMMMIRKFIP